MKVLLSTNHYGRMPGGAVAMAEMTHRLLERAGHEVIPFAIAEEGAHPSEWQDYWATAADLQSQLLPVNDELDTPWSFVARRKLARLVDAARPDVAHLHNVYGKLTLSIVDALIEKNIPTVLTLHEYRSICPNGWLATHDGVCHRCVGGSTLNAVRHRCVDGSLAKSAVAAAEAAIYRSRRQFDKIDMMLAPSHFLRDEVIAGGLDGDRIKVVYNPAERGELPARRPKEPPTFVFFGRLVQNKGIDVLLSAAKLLDDEARVVIFGSGRMEDHIRRRIENERLPVELRGYVGREAIRSELESAVASILPSIGYENAPMAILEAAGRGVPTIGSNIGAIPEMIDDAKTGVLVAPGDPPALADAMRDLASDPDRVIELGRGAWERIGTLHDPGDYLEAVVDSYEEITSGRGRVDEGAGSR